MPKARYSFLVAVVLVTLVRALGLKFGTSVEESASVKYNCELTTSEVQL